MKMLECTPGMAVNAKFQNQVEGLERWICCDAVSAHELLAIVRGLMSDDPFERSEALVLAQNWVEEKAA